MFSLILLDELHVTTETFSAAEYLHAVFAAADEVINLVIGRVPSDVWAYGGWTFLSFFSYVLGCPSTGHLLAKERDGSPLTSSQDLPD